MPKAVDLDRLRTLLAQGAESADLEYKSTWDPKEKPDVMELCKDIAAMESLTAGGYIVVGADGQGAPSGMFTPVDVSDFDEQKIRSKIAAMLGEPIDFNCALHVLGSNQYLLIGVGPNRDGVRILEKDRQYESKTVWRAGDVLVRRGTSSVRWNQHEARGIIERVVATRKEEWRADVFEMMKAATPAFEPGGQVSISLEMPAESFSATVVELIRRGDEIGLDLLLRRTISHALGLAETVPIVDAAAIAAELSGQLERIDIIAALAARYPIGATFAKAIEGYRRIYDAVDEDYTTHPSRFPLGHKEVLIHVYAVGALLVHERVWDCISQLVRLTPISTHDGYWKSLLRKAEVMVARSALLKDDDGMRIGLIEASRPVATRLLDLLEPVTSAQVTNLLIQFDVLRGIATAGVDPTEKLGAYTNFAFYYSKRAEPAFLTVLDDRRARAALFGGTDDELAAVYRTMNEVATREAFMFNGWEGFTDARLVAFAGARAD